MGPQEQIPLNAKLSLKGSKATKCSSQRRILTQGHEIRKFIRICQNDRWVIDPHDDNFDAEFVVGRRGGDALAV